LTLLLLLLALVVAGCGGDDGGKPTGGGGGPSVEASEDPATMLPAGAPIVVQIATNIDADQVQSALAFANRVEPTDRDLKAELLAALNEDDKVKFDSDIKPWIGDYGAFAIDGFGDEDVSGVLAVPTSDEAATKAALAKDDESGDRTATYKGIEYEVDEDGAASGVAKGFLIAASDETHFKSAIDASEGQSLADDAKYKDSIALAPADPLATAYIDVDPFLELIKASGELPPGTPDLSQIPGLEAGQTAIVSLLAEEDKVTVESASTAEAPDQGDAPDIAELPGDAWLALAAALDGEQFVAGFKEGLAASGAPEAQQMLEQLGLVDFLGKIDSVSMRVGGDSINNINAQFTLGGSDQDAASKVLQSSAEFAQQAAAAQGIQVEVDGDTATVSAGPYKLELKAEDGDLKMSLGDQPGDSLGDSDAFKSAEEELSLGDGKTIAFLDFVGLEKLLKALPQDEDLTQGLQVISQLESFVVGSGKIDDATAAKAVLTLR
jgi:hypothetical protein